MPFTKKECSEFYICDPTSGNFNIDQVLLCQYEMMDTAIFIKKQNKSSSILIHNFAHNNTPCNGLWDSKSQENQIYRRTDIKESIAQHKLYPIQNSITKNSHGIYSINMLVTQNCQIFRTDSGQNLKDSVLVDIVSMPALIAPPERSLDIYTTNQYEFNRTDYALHEDKEVMKQRIRFMLMYAMNESYDYFITGEWGIGTYLNPQWGMINLWNECITELPSNKLIIIFSIPIQSIHSTEETQYNYRYFCKYLVGQENQNIDFDKIKREKEKAEKVALLLKDNNTIQSKICGLVLGVLLAEINNQYMNMKGHNDGWDSNNADEKIDWEMSTDLTIVMMRALQATDLAVNINVIAEHLVAWKTTGFTDLSGHNYVCDYVIKHLLSQPGYVANPINVAKHIYVSKGKEDLKNTALTKNMINGIFKDYMYRSVTCCLLTNPGRASQVTCLVHSFVVRSIWENKFVTGSDISKLLNICFDMLGNDVQQKIDFDTHIAVARNYQNQKSIGLQSYLENNLKPSLLRPSDNIYVLLSIVLILLYDLQSYHKINGRVVREYNAIEMFDVDEQMSGKKIDYDKCLPADYYFRTIEIISKCNPDPVFNAVAGSIIGLACHRYVYDDTVMRDKSGNICENNSQQLIKRVTGCDWIIGEINQFIVKYLNVRATRVAN